MPCPTIKNTIFLCSGVVTAVTPFFSSFFFYFVPVDKKRKKKLIMYRSRFTNITLIYVRVYFNTRTGYEDA